jgi:hypothetical protein
MIRETFKKLQDEFNKFSINFTFVYHNEMLIINKNFRNCIKEWQNKEYGV